MDEPSEDGKLFVPGSKGPRVYYCPDHDFAWFKANCHQGWDWAWPSYSPNSSILPMATIANWDDPGPLTPTGAHGGTGKYLALSDLRNPSVQALYAEGNPQSSFIWWHVINYKWKPSMGSFHPDENLSSAVFADGHASMILPPADNDEWATIFGP